MISHSAHGGREFWSHFEASQLKEDATAPMTTGEDTSERRCEGHDRSPNSDRLLITGENTLERRCEGHERSLISDRRMTTSEDTLEKV